MKAKKLTRLAVALAVVTSFFAVPALARADNIVEGFYAKGTLKVGNIVTQLAKPASTVELTLALNSKEMFGVVVNGAKVPITLDRPGEQVFVAGGGSYQVLVDTENGAIKSGDYISMSAISGVGAKATGEQPTVVGQATSSFNGNSGVVQKTAGRNIGRINITVAVGSNPLYKNTLSIPQPLQRLGNTVAGAEVTPLRIYIAFVVFIVATTLSMILAVVGIRSSLISLGRNPLSRHTILGGLLQVIVVSLFIFIGSLVGVYLILRL